MAQSSQQTNSNLYTSQAGSYNPHIHHTQKAYQPQQAPQYYHQPVMPQIAPSNPFESNFNYPEFSFTDSNGSKNYDKNSKAPLLLNSPQEKFDNPFSEPSIDNEVHQTTLNLSDTYNPFSSKMGQGTGQSGGIKDPFYQQQYSPYPQQNYYYGNQPAYQTFNNHNPQQISQHYPRAYYAYPNSQSGSNATPHQYYPENPMHQHPSYQQQYQPQAIPPPMQSPGFSSLAFPKQSSNYPFSSSSSSSGKIPGGSFSMEQKQWKQGASNFLPNQNILPGSLGQDSSKNSSNYTNSAYVENAHPAFNAHRFLSNQTQSELMNNTTKSEGNHILNPPRAISELPPYVNQPHYINYSRQNLTDYNNRGSLNNLPMTQQDLSLEGINLKRIIGAQGQVQQQQNMNEEAAKRREEYLKKNAEIFAQKKSKQAVSN